MAGCVRIYVRMSGLSVSLCRTSVQRKACQSDVKERKGRGFNIRLSDFNILFSGETEPQSLIIRLQDVFTDCFNARFLNVGRKRCPFVSRKLAFCAAKDRLPRPHKPPFRPSDTPEREVNAGQAPDASAEHADLQAFAFTAVFRFFSQSYEDYFTATAFPKLLINIINVCYGHDAVPRLSVVRVTNLFN